MTYHEPIQDPATRRQIIEAEQARAAAHQEALTQQAEERRQQARARIVAFVNKHREARWIIAQSGVDPLRKVGSPTLETRRGDRISVGMIWEHDGNLYRIAAGYPLDLDPARYYPPKQGYILWWDGDRSVRMLEPLEFEIEALAREWITRQHTDTPAPTTATRKGKRRKNTPLNAS
jgi:hypothetical protein